MPGNVVQEHGGEPIIPFSGVLERNLADLEPAEAASIARKQVLFQRSSRLVSLRLISYFFTAGPDEVKCWQIRRQSKAPQAAGAIHTDFERGFICAVVMKFEDLKELGNCQKRSKRSHIRVGAMAADEGNVKIEKFDEGMKNEDWALLDRQALGVIRLTLSRNVAFNIAKEKSKAGLMAGLMAALSRASVAQHLNKLNTITTQLSSVEIEFNDEVRALILLSSLPDSWNTTVTAISSSSGNNKLKFDIVRDLVLSEEIRRR
ncbi:hypothetical protein F3Y22_tig00111783pilonHSYRG00183 [Hibiscus syriacus]|uniref:YchF C-terminal domain-containing protein n=1 Tax=Hibiscus syriacus TaxID=106335 RepID=A0A6A2YD14_HIBSY|nr:hypothetical protein F3Y22_tig00111783pilonHSYRG00183 [Hibiscus syriacus]